MHSSTPLGNGRIRRPCPTGRFSFSPSPAWPPGASWVCYFRALKLGEAYRVAPIDKLSVVLVAIFAVVFLGERPALRDWAGIACVGVGVLLLSLKR